MQAAEQYTPATDARYSGWRHGTLHRVHMGTHAAWRTEPSGHCQNDELDVSDAPPMGRAHTQHVIDAVDDDADDNRPLDTSRDGASTPRPLHREQR